MFTLLRQLPADTFLDRQSDSSMTPAGLHYTISHTVSWLRFDEPTRTLFGMPALPGVWPVTVTATDSGFRQGMDPPLATSVEILLHVRETQIDPRADDLWALRRLPPLDHARIQ